MLLLAGTLLISGVFCFLISLQQLTRVDGDFADVPPPPPDAEETEEEQPKLTRLGRPVMEIRLKP
ncbi:MAG: hypothetical protein QGI83_21755 [Candidatus Latescibacteria bacterium]|nr:hypothetical protein [Candidatus Latescibacterota bacterium]